MPTFFPNSKKCSRRNRGPSLAAAIAIASVAFLASPLALAAPTRPQPSGQTPAIKQALKKDLAAAAKATSFDPILAAWTQRYGAAAVGPLLEIASNGAESEVHRYIALMGAAKLGGEGAVAGITPLLKDNAWMIRSAALRALGALQIRDTKAASAVLPLLEDRALVVRLEAIEAVEKLRPQGAEDALVQALLNTSNYHAGRAQWVPQRALAALEKLGAKHAAPRLLPLLDHVQDPALQERTVAALERLTGKRLGDRSQMGAKIAAWKHELLPANAPKRSVAGN